MQLGCQGRNILLQDNTLIFKSNFGSLKFIKIICQKKRHAKTFRAIDLKRNHNKVYVNGLILIQFQMIWSEIVSVSFFFDKFSNFFTFLMSLCKKI